MQVSASACAEREQLRAGAHAPRVQQGDVRRAGAEDQEDDSRSVYYYSLIIYFGE
jgi:hypothetical protein